MFGICYYKTLYRKASDKNISNARTERRLREIGFWKRSTDVGLRTGTRTVQVEQQILDTVMNDPTSTRKLERFPASALRILHEQQWQL